MKRYYIDIYNGDEKECPNGEWVRFEDVEALEKSFDAVNKLCAEAQAENARLREALQQIHDRCGSDFAVDIAREALAVKP